MKATTLSFPQGTVRAEDDGAGGTRIVRRYGSHPSVAAYLDARAAASEHRSPGSTFDVVKLRTCTSRSARLGRS